MTIDVTKVKVNDTFEKAKADIIYVEQLGREIEIDIYDMTTNDEVISFMKWLIVTGRLYIVNNYVTNAKLRREINNLVYTYWRM